MVYGDDFMSVGNRAPAKKSHQQLESRLETKTQIMGPWDEAARNCAGYSDPAWTTQCDGRVLNRSVRWTPDERGVEPDQRHTDLIVQEMGMQEAKPVSTAGENASTSAEPGEVKIDDQQA